MCKAPSSKANGSSILNLAVSIGIFVYTLGFVFFRVAEITPLIAYYPRQCLSAFIGSVVIRHSSLLGRASKRLFHLLSLFGIIYLVDHYIPKPLPAAGGIHSSKTVVITGANSGVGFEAARQLAVNYGMSVVLGCRSKSKCDAAAKLINDEVVTSGISTQNKATPLIIDLADLQSVNSFISQLEGMHVDVLFNNAGYAPNAKLPVNKYGLDPSFTSMHLSHFLLTEELLKRNPSMRVVNTSSGTHHICAMPFAFFPKSLLDKFPPEQHPGCLDESFLANKITTETDSTAYIQAKIANVMHVVEISRHHPKSTSVAIDLGWVGTNIQPFMEWSLSPTNLGWMRSTTVGVLPVLHAILSSEKELMDGVERQWNDGGIIMNVFGRTEEAFTYPWWSEKINLGRARMMELSRGLWKVSKRLIEEHT